MVLFSIKVYFFSLWKRKSKTLYSSLIFRRRYVTLKEGKLHFAFRRLKSPKLRAESLIVILTVQMKLLVSCLIRSHSLSQAKMTSKVKNTRGKTFDLDLPEASLVEDLKKAITDIAHVNM